MKDLAGRRVLVTGGATGIGAAISHAFARAGAKVAVHFHAGGPAAAALLQEIQSEGGQALGIGADLTTRGKPSVLIDQVSLGFLKGDVKTDGVEDVNCAVVVRGNVKTAKVVAILASFVVPTTAAQPQFAYWS